MHPESIKRICAWLDISYKTMQRYISGESDPPRSVCYALFHESRWGRDLGFVEAYNDRQILVRDINELQSKVRGLTASLTDAQTALREAEAANENGSTFGAANDSNYGSKPLPRKSHTPPASFKRRTVRRAYR